MDLGFGYVLIVFIFLLSVYGAIDFHLLTPQEVIAIIALLIPTALKYALWKDI